MNGGTPPLSTTIIQSGLSQSLGSNRQHAYDDVYQPVTIPTAAAIPGQPQPSAPIPITGQTGGRKRDDSDDDRERGFQEFQERARSNSRISGGGSSKHEYMALRRRHSYEPPPGQGPGFAKK